MGTGTAGRGILRVWRGQWGPALSRREAHSQEQPLPKGQWCGARRGRGKAPPSHLLQLPPSPAGPLFCAKPHKTQGALAAWPSAPSRQKTLKETAPPPYHRGAWAVGLGRVTTGCSCCSPGPGLPGTPIPPSISCPAPRPGGGCLQRCRMARKLGVGEDQSRGNLGTFSHIHTPPILHNMGPPAAWGHLIAESCWAHPGCASCQLLAELALTHPCSAGGGYGPPEGETEAGLYRAHGQSCLLPMGQKGASPLAGGQHKGNTAVPVCVLSAAGGSLRAAAVQNLLITKGHRLTDSTVLQGPLATWPPPQGEATGTLGRERRVTLSSLRPKAGTSLLASQAWTVLSWAQKAGGLCGVVPGSQPGPWWLQPS